MSIVTIEELKKVVALSDLPDEHLQWILNHSEYEEIEDGDIIAKYGTPAETMWISLEGNVAFYMNINGRQVFYFMFENNHVTGGVGGLMPYSRMKTYPGNSYASGNVRLLRIHKDYFQELEHLNPEFIQKLIGYMTERAKAFATLQLQHEKVNALGNLAAGIAHELNNPAAAIKGISIELSKRLKLNFEFTKILLECNLNPKQIENIQKLVEKKINQQDLINKRSTLQRMQYEDELEEWLEQNGIEQRAAAETFSEYGFTIDELEIIRTEIGNESFIKTLPWLENLISSQKIITDLAEASERISFMVGSIKSHVHMDRTNELQLTNIHRDIENTLTLLGFKLREKNIELIKNFDNNLPEVPAYIGELNQVWTNLIDNAIYALPKKGRLIIETSFDDKNARITIMDNGSGIPNEIITKIFDPFFTTKKIGEGSGIGLDLVNRIVKRHNGETTVTSEPGKTVFKISIPLAQKNETK